MHGEWENLLRKWEFQRRICDIFSQDVCESIDFTSELELDIQIFLDENPSGVSIDQLPKVPFSKAIQIYCSSRNFRHPTIMIPLRNEILSIEGQGKVTLNNLFRALAVTFYILPAFELRKYNNINEIPTLEEKKEQILRLGVALVHSQERCRGKVNDRIFKGVDFLSFLAKKHGVKLFRKKSKGKGETEEEKFFKGKPRGFRKFERFHREGENIVPFLRRYVAAPHDLSSFMLEKEWALLSEDRPQRRTVREALREIIDRCSSKEWFSLHSYIFT